MNSSLVSSSRGLTCSAVSEVNKMTCTIDSEVSFACSSIRDVCTSMTHHITTSQRMPSRCHRVWSMFIKKTFQDVIKGDVSWTLDVLCIIQKDMITLIPHPCIEYTNVMGDTIHTVSRFTNLCVDYTSKRFHTFSWMCSDVLCIHMLFIMYRVVINRYLC